MTKISVILADAGFREQFHTVDCLNQQTLPRQHYELLWIEYYGRVNSRLKEKNVEITLLNRTGTRHLFNALLLPN